MCLECYYSDQDFWDHDGEEEEETEGVAPEPETHVDQSTLPLWDLPKADPTA